MAARNPQTMAKRAREQALKERRELKKAKKAETAAERAAGRERSFEGDPLTEAQASPPSPAPSL